MMGNWVLKQTTLALLDNYLFTHDLPETIEEMDQQILGMVNEHSLFME